MSAQYAGTPTGTGPALPASYYAAAVDEHDARIRALCQTDAIADWLSQECCTDLPYDGGRSSQHYHDERALGRDYLHSLTLSTPELLALAMGVAVNSQARLAALDELARRVVGGAA